MTADHGAEMDYDALPLIEQIGYRHAWDAWGRADQLGTINRLTPQRVVAAADLIQTGVVVALALPVGTISPPLFGRVQARHVMSASSRNGWDDALTDYAPSSGSHWDGLRHMRCREFGFFGGRDFEPVSGAGPIGVEHWARHGIVGRGVLLDLAADQVRSGGSRDPFIEGTVPVTELRNAADAQGVELRAGDVLCVRFGWLAKYRELAAGERGRLAAAPLSFLGLAADESMARFLWNTGIAAVVCDNPAVETWPGSRAAGSLHRRLIPLLGMALGELFDLDRLAAECATQGRYEFMFASTPVDLIGGVNSPANAIAIF
jgi:Putative cyclase